jgi:hypothetical protein
VVRSKASIEEDAPTASGCSLGLARNAHYSIFEAATVTKVPHFSPKLPRPRHQLTITTAFSSQLHSPTFSVALGIILRHKLGDGSNNSILPLPIRPLLRPRFRPLYRTCLNLNPCPCLAVSESKNYQQRSRLFFRSRLLFSFRSRGHSPNVGRRWIRGNNNQAADRATLYFLLYWFKRNVHRTWIA